jgi:hypothetical protein
LRAGRRGAEGKALTPGTYSIRPQVIDNTGNALKEKAEVTIKVQ